MPDPALPKALPARILVMDYTSLAVSSKMLRFRMEMVKDRLAAWPGVQSVKIAEHAPPIGLGDVHPTFNVDSLGQVLQKEPADAVALLFTIKSEPPPTGVFNPFRIGSAASGIFAIFSAIDQSRSPGAIESEVVVLGWPSQRVLLRLRVTDPVPPDGKSHFTSVEETQRIAEELGRKLVEAREEAMGLRASRPTTPEARPLPDTVPAKTMKLGLVITACDQVTPLEDGSLKDGKALAPPAEAAVFASLKEGLGGLPWIQELRLLPWADLGAPGSAQRLDAAAAAQGLDHVGLLVLRKRPSQERYPNRWWYAYTYAFDRFCGAHWPHVMFLLTQATLTIPGPANQPPLLLAAGLSTEEGPYVVSRFGYPKRQLEPLEGKGRLAACAALSKELQARGAARTEAQTAR
jgi:hypothetical protein